MKRKIFSALLAVGLALSLTACGAESDAPISAPADGPSVSSETPAQSSVPEETSASAESEPAADVSAPAESGVAEDAAAGKALVAYFSWSGNTEQIANMIAADTGAELFQIETAEPYTDDYSTLLEVAQNEQQENARPALSSTVENMEDYDIIYLGWPCWWSDCPMAILTFLESYDFSGKTIVPFTTSGSSGFGNSLSNVGAAAPNATLLDGLSVSSGSVDSAEDMVSDWLAGLGLKQ